VHLKDPAQKRSGAYGGSLIQLCGELLGALIITLAPHHLRGRSRARHRRRHHYQDRRLEQSWKFTSCRSIIANTPCWTARPSVAPHTRCMRQRTRCLR